LGVNEFEEGRRRPSRVDTLLRWSLVLHFIAQMLSSLVAVVSGAQLRALSFAINNHRRRQPAVPDLDLAMKSYKPQLV